MGSWNNIPSLATEHVPTSTEMAFITSLLAGMPEWRPAVIKASDETVNNSATLQNDDALFLSVVASAKYLIEMDLIYLSPVANDFKFDWTAPVGISGYWTALNPTLGSAASAPFLGALAWSSGGSFEGFAADMYARVRGHLITGANAGTLQLRWAQNSATAANTIVRTGSVLSAMRIA